MDARVGYRGLQILALALLHAGAYAVDMAASSMSAADTFCLMLIVYGIALAVTTLAYAATACLRDRTTEEVTLDREPMLDPDTNRMGLRPFAPVGAPAAADAWAPVVRARRTTRAQ